MTIQPLPQAQESDDRYQQAYLYHQQRKAIMLNPKKSPIPEIPDFDDILLYRRSIRIFDNRPIPPEKHWLLTAAATHAPTSCNRQAVSCCQTDSEEMEKLLVGGAGWLHRAPVTILFFADMMAYKSPAEQTFMPYLDTGHIAMSMQFMATRLGLGACFVNPNIREANKTMFAIKHNPNPDTLLFTGALAVGYYTTRPDMMPKNGPVPVGHQYE